MQSTQKAHIQVNQKVEVPSLMRKIRLRTSWAVVAIAISLLLGGFEASYSQSKTVTPGGQCNHQEFRFKTNASPVPVQQLIKVLLNMQ